MERGIDGTASSAAAEPSEVWPPVSVVLPVRNEARYIADTLEALVEGDYAGRLEILVVDGASEDETARMVAEVARRDRRVRLLANPARRTPAGLNIGLTAATGEIVLRMDGHAVPAPDYVRCCVEALRRTGAWCVGGRMVGRGDTDFGRAVAVLTRLALGAGDARFRVGAVRDGGSAVDTVYLGAWPRWVFDRVGPFNEGLSQNQDYELAYRIRQAGGKVWLDPSIQSETVTRGSVRALARQYWHYGRGRAATLLRHPRSLRWRQFVPAAFVATLAVLATEGTAAALKAPHDAPGTRLVIGMFACLLAVYGGVLATATVQVARQRGWSVAGHVPLALATMHLAWGAGLWVGLADGFAERLLSRAP